MVVLPWRCPNVCIARASGGLKNIVGSIAVTPPMLRRCVADVSPMCLGHFEPWCISSNVHRLLNAVRRFLASKHREKISIHACSRCPDALAKHGEYSRTSPIIRQTAGVWWRYPGDAQICKSLEHRDGLKAPWDRSIVVKTLIYCIAPYIVVHYLLYLLTSTVIPQTSSPRNSQEIIIIN